MTDTMPKEMDVDLELKKMAEESGELVQVSMKSAIWGYDEYSPKHECYNRDLMIEEMGDVLCHLKRTAVALGIGWDEIQQRSSIKNDKVNKYHYGE